MQLGCTLNEKAPQGNSGGGARQGPDDRGEGSKGRGQGPLPFIRGRWAPGAHRRPSHRLGGKWSEAIGTQGSRSPGYGGSSAADCMRAKSYALCSSQLEGGRGTLCAPLRPIAHRERARDAEGRGGSSLGRPFRGEPRELTTSALKEREARENQQWRRDPSGSRRLGRGVWGEGEALSPG